MVIMENYIPPQDRLDELWLELERCHLSYLELEESPEKIEQRNKLEEIIYEFLCIAPHRHKFCYAETEEVLQMSASRKKDFSAYKASTGFAAIQLYAGNLLSQPWRKEYRTIKTYCGFYKHQVEANLVGAELLFEAMGYKRERDGILVLHGPICPDRVSSVSRDCLIAYVECQILKIIWEELSSACMNTTWLEVLEFRRGHICSPEQVVKSFKYKQHQPEQYHEHSRHYSQGSNMVRHTLPAMPSAMSPVLPVNHSFPPLGNNHSVGLPDAMYSNGCCTNRCPSCTPFTCVSAAAVPPTSAYALYQPVLRPPFAPAPAYYFNGYMATPVAAPPPPMTAPQYVPTAQLVEVGGGMQNGAYDVVDGPQSCCKIQGGKVAAEAVGNSSVLRGKNNNELRMGDRETEKIGSHFEDWAYVYRNLESQGYTKDLGERGDILTTSLPKIPKDCRKTKSTNSDEVLNNLTISDRPLIMSEALRRSEIEKTKPIEVKKVDRQTSPDSSYDNVPATESKKHINKLNSTFNNQLIEGTIQTPQPQVNTANYAKTKSLPREKTSNHLEKANHNSFDLKKVIDFASQKKTDPNPVESPSSAGKWQCKACTFLNNPQLPICEMCSKSRDSALEQPMEIGGSECSKCTLVNSKFAKVCEACGASLANSPTYI
ncbi:unnamed protein product [Acanthoscelides obtectus]|uniref:RanBP2-type domain-containing protein n=3 Tax=Acanthoscelides obtectus TaxID=200917 RepID=A0A9P0JPV2_ACAOB|nr:unnamed protein product [Acanthoscelides obtectus]CAK1672866.1 Protein tamozhennic [Acanthoscelides obtectus]